VQLAPGDIPARHNLAVVLQAQGRLAEAASHYEQVLRLDARYPDAHYGLALVSKAQGNMAGAVQHYREALRSVPNWPEVLIDLAWLFATSTDPAVRNPQEAVELAERAVRATSPPSWAALDASAAALASAGRVREAADQARRALESAIATGNDAAASQIRERLTLYSK
jgi:tetratricopeptide (TPR) repeat protein